jgi:multicomponent Na+:H+ antiporter subunit C
MIVDLPYLAAGLLAILGLAAVLFERNLVKIAIGVSLIESAANLFLIALGYRSGGVVPLFTMAGRTSPMVLPTPQALTLTSIVIGLATTALMLSLIMRIYRLTGSLDVRDLRRLRG